MSLYLPRFKSIVWAGIAGLGLYFLSTPVSATPISKGLLIYSELSNYTESSEYTSLIIGPAYATVIRPDGTNFWLKSGANLTVVDYPSIDSDSNALDVVDWHLETIQNLLDQYPQFSTRLKAAQGKWRNARYLVIQSTVRDTAHPAAKPAPADKYADLSFASVKPSDEIPARAPIPRADPFVGFGGTSLDSRKGWVGSQSALKPVTLQASKVQPATASTPSTVSKGADSRSAKAGEPPAPSSASAAPVETGSGDAIDVPNTPEADSQSLEKSMKALESLSNLLSPSEPKSAPAGTP